MFCAAWSWSMLATKATTWVKKLQIKDPAAHFLQPDLDICCLQMQFVSERHCVQWLSINPSQTSPGFYLSAVQIFWKYSGKRRNCSSWAISPFPLVFFSLQRTFCHFHQIRNCRLQTLSVLEDPKICCLVKG